MGTTILQWCVIVEQKMAELSRFEQFLRPEDRAIFDDLLTQCRPYVAEAGTLASPLKEAPLLLSMII